MKIPKLTMGAAIQLASIVVHVEEAASADGHQFDVEAIKGHALNPEVQAWVKKFPKVLLPLKR